jgi:acetoin utilization protein AcuB
MMLKEIMTTRLVTVEPDDALDSIKQIFDSVKFHHLLVVDSG